MFMISSGHISEPKGGTNFPWGDSVSDILCVEPICGVGLLIHLIETAPPFTRSLICKGIRQCGTPPLQVSLIELQVLTRHFLRKGSAYLARQLTPLEIPLAAHQFPLRLY
jgi:hypothetical protein